MSNHYRVFVANQTNAEYRYDCRYPNASNIKCESEPIFHDDKTTLHKVYNSDNIDNCSFSCRLLIIN